MTSSLLIHFQGSTKSQQLAAHVMHNLRKELPTPTYNGLIVLLNESLTPPFWREKSQYGSYQHHSDFLSTVENLSLTNTQGHLFTLALILQHDLQEGLDQAFETEKIDPSADPKDWKYFLGRVYDHLKINRVPAATASAPKFIRPQS